MPPEGQLCRRHPNPLSPINQIFATTTRSEQQCRSRETKKTTRRPGPLCEGHTSNSICMCPGGSSACERCGADSSASPSTEHGDKSPSTEHGDKGTSACTKEVKRWSMKL